MNQHGAKDVSTYGIALRRHGSDMEDEHPDLRLRGQRVCKRYRFDYEAAGYQRLRGIDNVEEDDTEA